MPAAIFNGTKVKTLKDTLNVNDKYDLITGDSDDPTVVAKNGVIGSEYIRSTTGAKYKKLDAGTTTNWDLLNDSNLNVVNKAAGATLLIAEDVITADASGGAFTLTLPTAVGNSGKVFEIIKTDNDFGEAVTIDADGTEEINGSLTTTLNTQYEVVELVSNNVDWFIRDRRIVSEWVEEGSPAGLWSNRNTITFTSDTIHYSRVGDSLKMKFYFEPSGGVGSASSLQLTLPNSLVADTAKYDGNGIECVGKFFWYDNAGSSAQLDDSWGPAVMLNTTTIEFRKPFDSNLFATNILGVNDVFSGTIEVPISGWKG